MMNQVCIIRLHVLNILQWLWNGLRPYFLFTDPPSNLDDNVALLSHHMLQCLQMIFERESRNVVKTFVNLNIVTQMQEAVHIVYH